MFFLNFGVKGLTPAINLINSASILYKRTNNQTPLKNDPQETRFDFSAWNERASQNDNSSNKQQFWRHFVQ